MIPQNKLYVPGRLARIWRGAFIATFSACPRWLGQNGENHRQVATIGLETRKRRRTDRRYDIFFITPFVPNTANEYQFILYPIISLRVGEKRKRGLSLSLFLSFFFLAQIIRIILGRKHFNVRWRFYSWIEEEGVKIRCINRGKMDKNLVILFKDKNVTTLIRHNWMINDRRSNLSVNNGCRDCYRSRYWDKMGRA